ncbi:MAG: HK97 family phage prohead protease [Alphaproteobacteria bacterium]|nr:MAG: HK97 family phage prohead protease [Alphaproteobacteria bacterium]
MHHKVSPPVLIKSLDSRGNFFGYASVFDWIDRQGDTVAQGAFSHSLKKWHMQKKMPKMLWQHKHHEPIGKWTFMGEDPKGLYVEGRLLMDVGRARSAYALMKEGVLDGLSIGYEVKKSYQDQTTKARVLTEIDLHEISLVTFAANEKAKVHHVKSCRDDSDLLMQVRRLTQLITHENQRTL